MPTEYPETPIDQFLSLPCGLPGRKGTYKDWIKDCLIAIVEDTDGFSGKRPECDSSWYWALARDLCVVNPKLGDKSMALAINKLRSNGYDDNWQAVDELEEEFELKGSNRDVDLTWIEVVKYVVGS